jgi:pullulanase/glycogen debranching enzyme
MRQNPGSPYQVDNLGAVFDIIHQGPVISQVELIAEPWDLGDGGVVSELATRLAGSSDIYGHGGRDRYSSVNFVTCHDGLTLNDLVSYNHKHNEGNGEDNRDGESHNPSWNCGVEGPTDDRDVLALRARATTLLAFTRRLVAIRRAQPVGRPVRGDTLLPLLNASDASVPFTRPAFRPRPVWQCLIDTADHGREDRRYRGRGTFDLPPRSLALFRLAN